MVSAIIENNNTFPSCKTYNEGNYGFHSETIKKYYHIKKWYDLCKFFGFPLVKRNSGELNPRALINKETALKIRNSIKHGETVPSVSKKYKISKDIIYNIKSNKTWKSYE